MRASQPPKPHQHWHIDVSYLNVCATFYYLCSILDGYSRFVVHWDLRASMTEADIEIPAGRVTDETDYFRFALSRRKPRFRRIGDTT